MGTKANPYRIFFLFLLLGLLMVLMTPSLPALEYYADISITVDASGYVSIGGQTNYPNLTIQNTEMYTSKQQSYWLLNITKQEIFSEFVYDLTLPKGSSISYIKSSGSLRIEEDQGYLIVRGYGENESLSILIQYQIEKQDNSVLQENIVYLLMLPAILIVSILLLYVVFKEKKQKRTAPPSPQRIDSLPDLKGLNHRQKQIMQVLLKRNTPMTQTDIQKELQIPKASVSRNIRGLERKGLIEKEQIGMSNLIHLKKK